MDDAALDALILTARSIVLADLSARGVDDARAVSLLEEACSQRRWWVEQWPRGADFVAGLVAQDVQDHLSTLTRWPICMLVEDGHDELPIHGLHIEPDIGGPEPVWVCDEVGDLVAPLGHLD
ncbi:MAG: hypothetical protein QM572_06015 [Nocardioides sp.]|uniref:hypothetical protein n=1 Tax=Nocardioides sp. TaxID=35761 RepID=UPI0039E63C93